MSSVGSSFGSEFRNDGGASRMEGLSMMMAAVRRMEKRS